MLFAHRSERADHLVAALGDLLGEALTDPMVPEVISVPTRGVERWLTQRLSHRLGASAGDDGVCANVEFPFPGSLVGGATAVACGFEPESDPWRPERAVWPLLGLVDENLAEPFLAPLAAHLRAGSPPGAEGTPVRRFATIRHLADLYDRYAVHRPEMLKSWLEPERGASRDGNGLGEWQGELWRRLRRRIGVPSPAERLETTRAELREHPDRFDLPPRISLFGLTRLPVSHLLVLEAVAEHRDVHLFLLHPSGELWRKVEEVVTATGTYPLRRGEDATVSAAENALLRSWGRDAREMQLVLGAHGVRRSEHRPVEEGPVRSLLERLQSDVRADRDAPGAPRPGSAEDPRPLLDPSDDSLRVHSCHGRLRQVEVVRDAVLHLLAADSTLEPRDVIVMCPDIESFAPLIYAVFGSGGPSFERDEGAEPEPGPPQLRVRLADRSIRQTNPILGVTAQLLELAAGRVSASEVLDLAGREPVSRRFRFDKEDLGQIERWVAGTGIRWGLDAEHRTAWKLGHVSENTWAAGLDRLLLGVAVAEEDYRLVNGVLPLDDVPSGTVDLAGRFAEMTDRLRLALEALSGRRTVRAWCDALCDLTESLGLAAPDEQWQHDQLRRVLGEVAETAEDLEESPLLDISEVRSLLADRLRGRPTRANFRTGDLTICTLVPMRSVPHRVVCLLGLDDGAFPRKAAHDGDDLLLADPHVGDRDARSEDRQLLLDALLAATEHLVITFEGRDPRTNQERSPCVPVAELLDVVDRTVRSEDPHELARRRVVVEHPLQSFDQRNFRSDELVPGTPWSFDPVELEGARATTAEPAARQPFLAQPLTRLESPVVQLESLVRYLEHPVRTFLRDRLGWYASRGGDEVKDAMPVDLNALERWNVGDRMLTARLGGATLCEAKAAERARGLLPPGVLGDGELGEVEASVEALAATVASLTGGCREGGSLEVNVRLGDGRLLIGTVPDVYRCGSEECPELLVVRCVYSQLAAKHRLAAWARFLALTAAHPEAAVSAATIGRGEGTSLLIKMAELPALGAAPGERHVRALSLLAVLVDLYDRGMREPLPIYTKTSERFADALSHEEQPERACGAAWRSQPESHAEDGDPAHQLVLGEHVPFERLLAEAPREDESGPGWSAHPSRFGRLALRLWEPLLAHETRSVRK